MGKNEKVAKRARCIWPKVVTVVEYWGELVKSKQTRHQLRPPLLELQRHFISYFYYLIKSFEEIVRA